MLITPETCKGATLQMLIEESYTLSRELLQKRLPAGVRQHTILTLACITNELYQRMHLRNTPLSLAVGRH